MFAALAVGIACGVFAYGVAAVGAVAFSAAALLLFYSPFGQTRAFDGMLRFNVGIDTYERSDVETVLRNYCGRFVLITLRELTQGSRLEYAYHVRLKPRKAKDELVGRLKAIEDVRDVNLMLQETTVEL